MDLSTILADALEEADTLDRNAAGFSTTRVREIVSAVTSSTEDLRRRLNLADAELRSGLSERTLKRRHRELMDCGLAGFDEAGRMWFSKIAVPPRANEQEQRARGRRAAGA